MRVVADTNIVVSGFLWDGNERRLMDSARDGIVELFTSPALLDDFENVISRPKFASRLTIKDVNRRFLVEAYAELATVVGTKPLDALTSRDADDDEVLACAVAGSCEIIVTGDNDLLVLKEYRGIRILTTTQILAELKL